MAKVIDPYQRITIVIKAWARLRPEKTFSKFTLEDFTKVVAPSRDARKEVADLEALLQDALSRRDEADKVSAKALQRVVNAVRADPDEGDDGELYAAMGYMPRSARSTLQSIGRRLASKSAEVPEETEEVTES